MSANYYIEHGPTGRKYTPVLGNPYFYRGGRNWRKTMGTSFPDYLEAAWMIRTMVERHSNGEEIITIRDWRGPIHERDFRVVPA